jgi:hypothetical protein
LAGPSYVGGGFISEAFSLESQDGFGNPVNVTANTTFDISSDSGGIVNFYSEPSGTTTPISQVTIANGTSSATFYYEDTLAGTPTVTAAWDSGGTDLGSDTHQITVDVVVGQIAFVSERDGNKEIYVVNADGSGQTRLTDNSADDCKPSWRPQPRIIPHSYEFVSEWGSQGSEEGQFNYTTGIAVDSSDNVYVVDKFNHRVQKFTSDGTFQGWWGLDDEDGTGWHGPNSGRTGRAGSGNGQFNEPHGIAIDSLGYVYVDDYNHRIQKCHLRWNVCNPVGELW